MNTKVLFFAILAMVTIPVSAQFSRQSESEVYNKLFYVELGGPGVIMSMNYDMRFNQESRLGFGFRVGAGFGISDFKVATGNGGYGYEAFDYQTHSYYSIPLQINYVFGKEHSSSTFEVGAGTSFLTRAVSLYNYDTVKEGQFIGHLSFMYRMQPVRSGFSLRVGFTPIIGTAGDLFPMVGVSLGYVF
ncbi:hypothetical protein FACS189413_05560 [Bacteroidia bacterium]|nr:hypothetical protein FACS189413_05560 [Bacteroidia bacterium]